MRILHTADLHLGRSLAHHSLEQDQQAVLDQIIAAMLLHKPDVLIIAGDIFDRPTVSQRVVAQFNDFVRRVADETESALVMISGNHDAGERIEAMGLLPDIKRVLIKGSAVSAEKPLILNDEHGIVAFTGLPYLDEFSAREVFNDPSISSPEDILRAQFECAKVNVPNGARWVVVAHTFVAGAQAMEIEQPLSRIGGIDAVPGAVFEEANYVALGHLHKPQSMFKEHIRYSGAPLALGFDESGAQKSFCLVDMDAYGDVCIEEIPVKPLRELKVLKGNFAELLASQKASEDFFRIILTDLEHQIDPAKRLREIFPNFCSLEYAKDSEEIGEAALQNDLEATLPTPEAVIKSFLKQVRNSEISEQEDLLINQYLSAFGAKETSV